MTGPAVAALGEAHQARFSAAAGPAPSAAAAVAAAMAAAAGAKMPGTPIESSVKAVLAWVTGSPAVESCKAPSASELGCMVLVGGMDSVGSDRWQDASIVLLSQ